MAIKTPTAPGKPGRAPSKAAAKAAEQAAVDGVPRHGGDGRPKIRTGATATFSYYMRASALGKIVEDTYSLDRWQKRVLVWGLSRRRDLHLAAQAVPAWEDRDDKAAHDAARDELNRIADEAYAEAKSHKAADRGTALHLLSEQFDAGVDLTHTDDVTWEALTTWRRYMSMFRIIATETFVVHDEWGVAGSFDRLGELLVEVTVRDGDGEVLAVLPAGTRVIIDLKSGLSSDYFGCAYAAQLAVYAGGRPYVHVEAAGDDGRRDWPDGIAPHPGWALIPHVPVDRPQDAGLLWVDLEVGRQVAAAAIAAKAVQKAARGAFYAGDVVEQPGITPQIERAADRAAAAHDDMMAGFVETMVEIIRAAPDEATIERLYIQHAEDWCEQFTAEAEQRLDVLAAEAAPYDVPLVVDGALAGPGEVAAVDLIAAVRACTTEAQIADLYTAHSDAWTDYVGKVADAHLDQLAAAQARSA